MNEAAMMLDAVLMPELGAYLRDPAIEDVAINEPGSAWIRGPKGWEQVSTGLDYITTEDVAVLCGSLRKQDVGRTNPFCGGELHTGHRFQWVLPPATPTGTVCGVIRRHSDRISEIDDVPQRYDTSRWNQWGQRRLARRADSEELLSLYRSGDVVAFLHAMARNRRTVILLGPTGVGKAQPLDAKVLTPTGWRAMGDLAVGDFVTCPDGRAAPITGVFQQGEKDIYRVTFADGRTVECCDDHLWKVWEWTCDHEVGKTHATRALISGARWSVLPLSTIRSWFSRGLLKAGRAAVPLVEPCAVEFPPQDLPVPPYALGALLGDGCLRDFVGFSTADEHILRRLSEDLPDYKAVWRSHYDYTLVLREKKRHLRGSTKRVISETLAGFPRGGHKGRELLLSVDGETKPITQWAAEREVRREHVYTRLGLWGWTVKAALEIDQRPHWNGAFSPLPAALRDMGLSWKKSHEKFVPDVYKRGSVAQRLALLQGLMDTDGSVGRHGTSATFTSTSEQLAKDVQEIAWSLGAVASISLRQTHFTNKHGKKQAGLPSYRVNIMYSDVSRFFSLPRKLDKCRPNPVERRLRIVAVDYVGAKPAQCIAVDCPDHLYVTDGYVVTHNTYMGKTILAGMDPSLRLVTIEDALELALRQKNVVRLLFSATDENGVTPRDCHHAALRLRPDVIPVQELRDPTCTWIYINEIALAHPGSPATTHGGTAPEGARRVFGLLKGTTEGASIGDDILLSMMGTAIDAFIPIGTDGSNRQMHEVWFADEAATRGETMADLLRMP